MRIILHAIPRARARRSAHTCNCVLPRHKNSEHTRNSFRGKCPIIVPSFFTATAYRLEDFSHTNASNRCRPYFFIYVVAANTILFVKHFHGSYSLRTFFDS